MLLKMTSRRPPELTNPILWPSQNPLSHHLLAFFQDFNLTQHHYHSRRKKLVRTKKNLTYHFRGAESGRIVIEVCRDGTFSFGGYGCRFTFFFSFLPNAKIPGHSLVTGRPAQGQGCTFHFTRAVGKGWSLQAYVLILKTRLSTALESCKSHWECF